LRELFYCFNYCFKQQHKQGDKMNFYNWFTTFLNEKNIEMGEFLQNNKQVGDVCQAICDTCPSEQSKIKDILVQIDFSNGNVYHFLNHLSKAL